MTAVDPVLGTQVFKVDPDRSYSPLSHPSHIGLGQLTREGFDDNVRYLHVSKVCGPVTNLNGTKLLNGGLCGKSGAQAGETLKIVDPQSDLGAVFLRQLASQSPANPYVAEIVDDMAKQVPPHVCPDFLT